jgi:hypothetical protein
MKGILPRKIKTHTSQSGPVICTVRHKPFRLYQHHDYCHYSPISENSLNFFTQIYRSNANLSHPAVPNSASLQADYHILFSSSDASRHNSDKWVSCVQGYNGHDYWTSGNRLGTDMLIWMSSGVTFNATFDYMRKTPSNELDNSTNGPTGVESTEGNLSPSTKPVSARRARHRQGYDHYCVQAADVTLTVHSSTDCSSMLIMFEFNKTKNVAAHRDVINRLQ